MLREMAVAHIATDNHGGLNPMGKGQGDVSERVVWFIRIHTGQAPQGDSEQLKEGMSCGFTTWKN